MALANKETDLHALNTFSSSIDKLSFKKLACLCYSLGLVVLEKSYTQTRMPTPQGDDIKMKKCNLLPKMVTCRTKF